MTRHGLAQNPELEALYTRAHEMARADVEADRDPQTLTGDMAVAQYEYDEEYMDALINKDTN